MGHRVHTGVGSQLLRHGLSQSRVDDGDVRGDVEVSQRVFDAFVVVGDDREGGDFGSGAGGGRNRAEFCFGAQFREVERDAQLLEGGVRVLIERPHRFCSVDWGAAADRDDPVRLELAHLLGALHDGLDRRVGLDALEQANFHAGLFQVVANFVQETKALHAAASDNHDGAFALQGFQRLQSAFSMIKISW